MCFIPQAPVLGTVQSIMGDSGSNETLSLTSENSLFKDKTDPQTTNSHTKLTRGPRDAQPNDYDARVREGFRAGEAWTGL